MTVYGWFLFRVGSLCLRLDHGRPVTVRTSDYYLSTRTSTEKRSTTKET